MSCIEIVGTTGAGHTANPVVSQGKMSSSIREMRASPKPDLHLKPSVPRSEDKERTRLHMNPEVVNPD